MSRTCTSSGTSSPRNALTFRIARCAKAPRLSRPVTPPRGARAGAHSGLENPGPGKHVGEDEDRPNVLRIDDLRAPRHLQHVLGEGRPYGREAGAPRRAYRQSFGLSDEIVVSHDSGVCVELAAGSERDQMAALPVVDEQDAVARAEHAAHRAFRTGIGSPTARARSRQNAQ